MSFSKNNSDIFSVKDIYSQNYMEYQIKFRFVSYYYDDIHQFTHRIFNFIHNYYEIIFDKGEVLKKDKMIIAGENEIIFGEILPNFLTHNRIKNFTLSKEKNIQELLNEIEDYIFSYRREEFNKERNSIIITLNHSLD